MSNLKSSVRLVGLTPHMVLADAEVNRVMLSYGIAPTITSGSDSKHSATALHYSGNALDYRIRDMPDGYARVIARDLQISLAPLFDVVLESDHIHIEYDPPQEHVHDPPEGQDAT